MLCQTLMQCLLLILKEHNLINALPQEILVETTEDILGVTLVQDLDKFVLLKLFQDDKDRALGFMAQRQDVAQSKRAELVADDCGGFQEHDAFDADLLLLGVSIPSVFQEVVKQG